VSSPSYSRLGASERAASLLDGGSFVARPSSSATSPIACGHGKLDGREIAVAFIDGHRHGGTLGIAEATVLDLVLEELLAATTTAAGAPPLLLGFDTGGVRVEEGPAALAAVSAVGVALARLVARGGSVISIISGPRGCFGAPSVMAALPQTVIMVDGSHWGLTGPKLIQHVRGESIDDEAVDASSARSRLANGDANRIVDDSVAAVRSAVAATLNERKAEFLDPVAIVARSRAVCASLLDGLQRSGSFERQKFRVARPRDLLRYSFRGQWHPEGEVHRTDLVHAALGRLGDRAALSLIVGPEQIDGTGVGIEEAALVTEMVDRAVRRDGPPAVILTFVFCQGHVVDAAQERFGLPRALAECLRALVAARLRGHPIITTLGGGTYGAAYLAFAAPSHRVLAMRGTSVAPMAPDVLKAFQKLRGEKPGHEVTAQLAELIPAVRTVDSVIRLPRVLRDELGDLLAHEFAES